MSQADKETMELLIEKEAEMEASISKAEAKAKEVIAEAGNKADMVNEEYLTEKKAQDEKSNSKEEELKKTLKEQQLIELSKIEGQLKESYNKGRTSCEELVRKKLVDIK